MKRAPVCFWLISLAALNALGSSKPAAPNASRCSVKARSLCEVVAKARRFDKKVVTVKALYSPTPEYTLLTGAACPRVFVDYRSKLQEQVDPKLLSSLQSGVPVVVRGVFLVDPPNVLCDSPSCAPYHLEVQQLLCAGN